MLVESIELVGGFDAFVFVVVEVLLLYDDGDEKLIVELVDMFSDFFLFVVEVLVVKKVILCLNVCKLM